MNAYAFRRDPHESACDAWRALDRAFFRWVRAHGGSELLATVGAWTSLADGNGDTALPLRDATNRHGMSRLSDADIAALRDEPMVGNGRDVSVKPFVLDADGRFYLWRNHRHEHVVAAAISRLLAASRTIVVVEDDLDALFHGRRDRAIAPQREAVRRVGGRRLFVLTGGPGTGKTTTVLRMLLMLQRQQQRLSQTPLTMQLAAPTGKAAQRLVQALQRGKQDLVAAIDAQPHPQIPLPSDWHGLLATIPDTEALTLHRLLGYNPHRNAFRHSARNPIAADVVVVDEASMVDLALLRSLLDALRPDATLILVGDADQLTSVAAGSVLMDLVSVMESGHAEDIVRLRHSFRAEQSLATINESVRNGDRAALIDALAAADHQAVQHAVADTSQLAIALRRWTDALAMREHVRPQLPNIGDDATQDAAHATVLACLDVLATRQLLCALREGEFGAQTINAMIERHLKRAWKIADAATWYAGRAIIVTRNDYATRLFNGDIGLCLADADGHLRVWFASVDNSGQPAARSFDPHALPAHDSAFAITIHKSQGSEYARVAVLLPPEADHRILSRQLLYTGLSRAKHAVELWSTDAALEAALAQPVHRAGGLASRLCASTGTASGRAQDDT